MITRILFITLFSLSCAIVADADPLTLTNGGFGTFRSPNFATNSGGASGPRISFSGGFTNFDCGAGGCGSPNQGFLSSLNTANAGNGGVLIIDGVTHSAFTISFGFTETTVTGTINVFASRDVPVGPPLFSVDFIGFGFITTVVNPDFPQTISTQFTIQNVPEPGSLFLIGLGVAGLAVKLKRRSR